MTKEEVIEIAFCDIINIVHHNFGSAEDKALKKFLNMFIGRVREVN